MKTACFCVLCVPIFTGVVEILHLIITLKEKIKVTRQWIKSLLNGPELYSAEDYCEQKGGKFSLIAHSHCRPLTFLFMPDP